MGKINNECLIQTCSDSKPEHIRIESHWNRRDFVKIIIGKECVVVSGVEIKMAIDNCMNVGT